jgi:hypothetical protein
MDESLLIARKMRRQSAERYLTDFVAVSVEEQAPINAISTHIDMEAALNLAW